MSIKKIYIGIAFISCFFFILSSPVAAEQKIDGQLIIINKSVNKLAFFEDGILQRVFHVATGKYAQLTPEGIFPIVTKIKNRPYFKEKIPGGDPRNPLGDRWLGLDALGYYGNNFAIHGNNNPRSIGTYASSGCVRMHNAEIRWLFEKVELHTPVIILKSNKSFDVIAKEHGYYTEQGVPVTIRNGRVLFEREQLTKSPENMYSPQGAFAKQ
ncbi:MULTISPECIES: L,D-transpeptidase [Aeribacillus]|jgi:Uncharacterized protein conserved in bacteria|uniref:L,D-TPase catalytic domain-containing protein n=2 Tax=Aeribacillus TaxID=1055323 RepID=A0A163Y8Y5_9BACI|nr:MULTISPECIES: L,D-transpeptidase [Aeribacillus]REJ22759.1 MAG: L,D-transpeptidase [Bacillaceae bacterium]KZM53350.1 hypothetical protein A3Q35_02720 [Aeribacillus pallidus]KZN95305.1 hypothetical protein AZI98_14995 [Aeribacillus pallidus]MDR9793084.1 L,D-transpeptidase [Aeribacillus pallidus]MDR9796918.1 L,D-transpeptidase [Aeribacillus pallidus]